MPLIELIYNWNTRDITLIQTKLQLITLTYNDGFQNKMYHILGVLMLKITILLLFWIKLACIGLDYYITNNNTFNDIVINNLTKLYNITWSCSSIQDYIFQTKPPFYSWKKCQPPSFLNKQTNLWQPFRFISKLENVLVLVI
jgi:hypothetical protein